MKLFQMGGDACDWVMANSKTEAKEIYASVTDVPPDDEIREVTEKEMQNLRFIDDVNDPDNSKGRSFAEELRNRVAAGDAPGMFASSEF